MRGEEAGAVGVELDAIEDGGGVAEDEVDTAFDVGVDVDCKMRYTFYLGRPWRAYSRVIYINTELPAEMNPAGWNNWGSAANESTAYYAESNSTGPGASPSTRVPWSHQLTPALARKYLPLPFLAGSDHWNPIAAAAKLP